MKPQSDMKRFSNLLWMTLLAVSMSMSSCGDKPEVDNPIDKDPNYKYIIVMSDIHVMAPELLQKRGTAYDNYLSQDPKLLEYSGEALECLVNETLRRKPDLVIIPGDLTKDGELVSHRLVVSVLGRLRSAGIPVIVVPGNHDIDNPEGYYFDGDKTSPAERTSPEQFASLYADFGYNQAYAKDPASLSFVCEPVEGLVLLCIDTNKYEENLFVDKGADKNYNQTSGRIRPATLTWMLAEADKAREAEKQVVLVQHHDAQGAVQKDYIVPDYEDVSKQLMEHGVHLAFTGHTHLQDIAQYRLVADSAQVDSLVEVATGSNISYPNPWRTIKVSKDFKEWQFHTEYLTSVPSLSTVRSTCYQRLHDNIKGGLGWHIKDGWSTINDYRETLLALGAPKDFIPETPEGLTELLMTYLGEQMCNIMIIHNEANEWKNPAAAEQQRLLKSNMEKMLRDRSVQSGLDETQTTGVVNFFNIIYGKYFEPGLTSMLTDINQNNAPDPRLQSRTDDLDVVLRL